jgi:mannose-1-phosphate guanylyltransferase/mannose-6-phosphate isomerase
MTSILPGRIVLESERRDSGHDIAVAAEIAFRQDPGTIVAIFAANHAIEDSAGFVALCEQAAAAAAQGAIVTLGVTPDHAATGYAYIRRGDPIGETGAFQVAAFAEKPAAVVAQRFVADGYL